MSEVPISAKPWVARLSAYEAGRPIEDVAREHGLDPDSILKLASNENLLGPSPRAVAAMQDCIARMHLYPDGNAYRLRQAIASSMEVDPSQVFVGHGSNEIIALLGHVYLDARTNAVMADRAFVVYRLVAALYEAGVLDVPMRAYVHDLVAMRAAVNEQTRLVFVANPNNPTGTAVDPDELQAFIETMPAHVVVVIDEAYIELMPESRRPDLRSYIRAGRPVVLLRTFSKAHGLAGLRIGYAIAPAPIVSLLHRVRQPFNVNAMALAAAEAALADVEHQQATRDLSCAGVRQLESAFAAMGYPFVPSVANFVLVEVGEGRAIFDALRRKGIIVRPMDAYGLPRHIRVTVGTPADNDRFLAALMEARKEHITS